MLSEHFFLAINSSESQNSFSKDNDVLCFFKLIDFFINIHLSHLIEKNQQFPDEVNKETDRLVEPILNYNFFCQNFGISNKGIDIARNTNNSFNF